MSFLTYASTRPWAKAIKSAVINRDMPPWFAAPHYAELRNAPRLTPADINTLAAWADSGGSAFGSDEGSANVRNGWKADPSGQDVVTQSDAMALASEAHGHEKGA